MSEDSPAPSGKFGVEHRDDGGLYLAFYDSRGLLAATVNLDAEAAADFRAAINETDGR